MRVSLQPAYVLHSRPYRDSSLLLEAFTAQQGRLSLVAKGVRRRSRRGSVGAVLQPFAPLLLSFSGRAELKTLVATEAAGQSFRLLGEHLFSGIYLNELLLRLLPRHDPHPRLFAAYGNALAHLGGRRPITPLLRGFELALLDELGYSFALTHDGMNGEPIDEASSYRYEPGHGLCLLGQGADAGEKAYEGAHLLAMAGGCFSGAVGASAKRLLREALEEHLGGEPLRSRELFQSVRGQKRSTCITDPDLVAAPGGEG